MLRTVLGAAALLLSPLGTDAATYTMQGGGACVVGGESPACTAETTFSIDPAFYGQTVPIDTIVTISYGAAEPFYASLSWDDGPNANGVSGNCTDVCAYAITNGSGGLLDVFGWCIYCGYDAMFTLRGWSVENATYGITQGYGTWNLLSAPIPPAAPMLITGLLGLGWIRRRRRRSANRS